MCKSGRLTYCCLTAIARFLACITRCLVSMQEVLNSTWNRFALHTAGKVGSWPNYTTGELNQLPEVRYNVRRGRIGRIEPQTFKFDHIGCDLQQSVV